MADPRPATLPEPPYYAVVFTSLRAQVDDGYADTAKAMFELVQSQPGFLAADSVRGADGLGITVAYFTDEPSVRAWKANAEHALASNSAGRSGTTPTPCTSPKSNAPTASTADLPGLQLDL